MKMPKEVRRRIFYSLIAIFLVLGSSVVLYAQGWRAWFQPLGFGKVGAIYTRTFPADAKITLDGKIKERKIGWVEKGTLLNNLLPGEYKIEASASGFKPFALPIVVTSSVVTGLQNIVLVPDAPAMTTSTPAQDIFLAGTTLLIKNTSGARTLAGMTISGNEILAGSDDGTMVLSYASAARNYFAAEISRSTSTNMGKLPGQPAGKAAISFQPVPGDDTLFLAKGPAGLHLLRAPSGEVLRLTTTTVIASAAAPGKIIWATFDSKTNASILSAYDILSQNRNADFEFVPGKIASLFILESGSIFALTKDASLYSLNLNQSNRVRLAQNARSVTFAENSGKMAVLGSKGVQIFFLRGDKPNFDISLPDPARIQKLIWYRDGEHLFVQYPDRIMFFGLIDQELKNFTLAAETSRAEYEPNSNTLYFLRDNKLYELKFPSS